MRRDFPRVELKVMHAGMVRLEEFLIDGRVDVALLSELSRSRLIVSTRLAQEEMVLVTQPGGAAAGGIVGGEELSRTPLILGDGLRAAMDALLAGRGIELKVEIEVNDHETIRLMVQEGVAASILPYSSVARECARGLARGAPHHRGRDLSHACPRRRASAAPPPWRARRWCARSARSSPNGARRPLALGRAAPIDAAARPGGP